MGDSISTQVVNFFRFMRLFRITLFSIIRIETNSIYAIVAWEEDCKDGLPDADDTQTVLWTCDTDSKINDAVIVGEHAFDAGWVSSDKLTVDKHELMNLLGWDMERTTTALDLLLKMRVSMIDNGEKSDAFFLHQ